MDYLMVLIQRQIFKIIIRKYKTTSDPPIHIYINRINNILVFKIKDRYKLELQTPNMEKKILGTATKTRLDTLKTASKRLVHKTTETTAEFIRNKIAIKVVKPTPAPDENSRNVEEIAIPPEKWEEIL